MTKSHYKHLVEEGVKIYEFKGGFIHAKTLLCDDDFGVVGTINFDYRSFVHHFECGVWMYKSDSLKEIKYDFIDLFDNKTVYIDDKKAKLRIHESILSGIMRAFSPLL